MNSSWMAADGADEPVARASTVRAGSRDSDRLGHRLRHAATGRVTLFLGWPASRKVML